jgi:hypothetical protein
VSCVVKETILDLLDVLNCSRTSPHIDIKAISGALDLNLSLQLLSRDPGTPSLAVFGLGINRRCAEDVHRSHLGVMFSGGPHGDGPRKSGLRSLHCDRSGNFLLRPAALKQCLGRSCCGAVTVHRLFHTRIRLQREKRAENEGE